MSRVLVIGLDGATFRLLDGWMERGLMPHLQRRTEAGTRAVLHSVVPPVTAPAWTSFATGVTPGRHGIYDFWVREPGQLRRQLVSAREAQAPPVWDLLADAGLQVGLINLPVSYPPSPRLSFAISDMLTPRAAPHFTQPPALFAELSPQLGEYVTDAPALHSTGPGAMADFLQSLEHGARQQAKYAAHLLEKKAWDCAVVVFMATDWLQHRLWDLLAGEFAVYPDNSVSRRLKAQAEAFLPVLDELLGQLLATCPEETNVMVVSDHGFGPLRGRFKINRWLASQKLLTAARRRGPWGRLLRGMDFLHLRRRLLRTLRRGKGTGAIPVWQWIDWNKTQAYASSLSSMGIYLNVRGREARGVVSPGAEYEAVREQILAGLRELRHPQTDRLLVTEARRREEVFRGPHLEEAPDVLFVLEEGACGIDVRLEGPLFERATAGAWTGSHRIDGVLLASGPAIKPGASLAQADIIDIAPTLLRLFGLPVPAHMEGKVLTPLLAERAVAPRGPVEFAAPTAGERAQEESAYTEEQALQVEQRLRDLGYL